MTRDAEQQLYTEETARLLLTQCRTVIIYMMAEQQLYAEKTARLLPDTV